MHKMSVCSKNVWGMAPQIPLATPMRLSFKNNWKGRFLNSHLSRRRQHAPCAVFQKR